MEKEHSDLQTHISRTDWWCTNLGMWRATVTGGEVRVCVGVYMYSMCIGDILGVSVEACSPYVLCMFSV